MSDAANPGWKSKYSVHLPGQHRRSLRGGDGDLRSIAALAGLNNVSFLSVILPMATDCDGVSSIPISETQDDLQNPTRTN